MCVPVDDKPCMCVMKYRNVCACGICQVCHRKIKEKVM
jgi:hypothetical protein